MTRSLSLAAPAAALLLAGLLLAACGGSDGEAPASHTVSENGVMHKSGLTNPTVNCVACHGSDLKGGSGPSCYSCHGQKW